MSLWTQRAQLACGFITRLAWSPDGGRLAVAHGAGIWLWQGSFGGAPTRRLIDHNAPVKAVVFSPDSHVIASASLDSTVRLWMAATGQSLHVLRKHTDAVNAVAFSADGRLLASGGGDQRVLIFDMLDSAGSSALAGHSGEITSVVFCGETLASGGWDETIRLWDSAARRPRAVIACGDWIRDLAASPDGRTLAAACKDGTLRLIEVASGTVTRVLEAHERGADCAAFSPDGSLLVSGGRDHAIRLWDWRGASDQPLQTLESHSRAVLTVAFHPAGTLIASGSGDNTIRLWSSAE